MHLVQTIKQDQKKKSTLNSIHILQAIKQDYKSISTLKPKHRGEKRDENTGWGGRDIDMEREVLERERGNRKGGERERDGQRVFMFGG